MRQLACKILGAIALITTGSAQAYVQSGAVTLDPYIGPAIYPGVNADFILHFGSRPASLGLQYSPTLLSFPFITADADIALRLTRPGEVLTADTFKLPNPAATPQGLSLAEVNGKDFYLAGMVTTGPRDPGEPAWDPVTSPVIQRFGWAHFVVNAQGVLTVADSAMAYVEQGIVAGTVQAVPEPGTYALMGIGLVGLVGLSALRKARRD